MLIAAVIFELSSAKLSRSCGSPNKNREITRNLTLNLFQFNVQRVNNLANTLND